MYLDGLQLHVDEVLVTIKTFKHKELKRFFESGSKVGIQAAHANKIGRSFFNLRMVTPKM